jgi:hypothetical protein
MAQRAAELLLAADLTQVMARGYASGSITETTTGATSNTTQAISGAIVGAQIGANFQYQGALFGVEVDGNWSNQQGSGSSGTSLGGSVPWLATAEAQVMCGSRPPQVPARSPSASTAWVAGVGQESVINRNSAV